MIRQGIDILLQQNHLWKWQRIGLVTNEAATDSQNKPSRQALLQAGFNIIKLFSPEHGLDMIGADGAKMHDGIDELTKLPVISLYGDKLQPTAEDLHDTDILLFDIPDIGCRFYTYLWTMTHVLEACGKHNKRLVILDRPNPLSGNLQLAEGPMLDETNCASFIGRWNIPLKHSCTIGELALYFYRPKKIQADVEVIPCSGWNREMFQPDWGLTFVPTSPDMRSFDSALLYPGLGLLEATNISMGRGTELPFQIAGAPWMNPEKIVAESNLPGVVLTPIHFTPTQSRYKNQLCKGVKFDVADKTSFHPVATGLSFIKMIKDMYQSQFQWEPYSTNVNPSGRHHLDKLSGIFESEQLFELSLTEFQRKIKYLTNIPSWENDIHPFLLY